MRRRLAILALALLLAGCAGTSNTAEQRSLTALSIPSPAPTSTPPATGRAGCGDPTASLRPSTAIPPGSLMDRIRRRGRLIAGVDQNTLLFAYLRPGTGHVEGFEIDVLRQIARALGVPLDLRAVTTAQRFKAVQTGAVDLVADAATVNCARLHQVAFSTVYYQAAQRLLVPSASRARSLADLAGRNVCTTATSTALATIVRSHARPLVRAQRTDCLVALQQGAAAAIASDDAILLGFRVQDPDTKLVGRRLTEEPWAIAINRRDPEFVRYVNAVLERMRTDGTWERLYHRWLGAVAPPVSPPTPHYR